jgi:transposase
MRLVPIKTDEQLDFQAIHRVRDRLIERRTSLINQLRAFLLERGITVRAGREWFRREIPTVLSVVEQQMSGRIARLLTRMVEQWNALDQDIDEVNAEIEAIAKADQACQRLLTIPGDRPAGCDGHGCGHRQWLGIQQRPRICGLARAGAAAVLEGRQTQVARHQQARE